MEDFVCAGGTDLSHPPINHPLIKIPAARVSDWKIPRPAINSDSVPHNKTVVTRPTGTKRLEIGIARFEVNCNLRSV